ncbi:SHOCT domain-containing protein [Rothia nasisuis]|uniref:SHOCT domain-containing protein n=1 Tax=Rothia nasisuis TaxID=2109647 RepID=UPI001F217B08|nr:SHOCT domain-containing protein [Rothia nasisuis]
MDGFIIFLLLIFMIFCLVMMDKDKRKKNEQKINSVKQKLDAELKDVGVKKKFENHLPNGSGITGDVNGDLYVINGFSKAPKRIKGSEVAEVSLIVNNTTESKTVNKGGITRAVAGGIAFGGAGAVVGAVTSGAKTTSTERVGEIRVELVTTSGGGFTYSHIFLPKGSVATNDRAQKLLSEAKVLKAQIEEAVKISNSKNSVMDPFNSAQSHAKTENAHDKYDTISKLGELHSKGLLTDEEFSREKSKLLGE